MVHGSDDKNEFGYTETTSHILAYARAVENNELAIGGYVVFWTVGAGTTCVCIVSIFREEKLCNLKY